MKAKLFGATAEAPQLWRCADVLVVRPRPRSVMRALLLGAHIVAFAPESDGQRELASAIEARGLGATAGNALLIAAALEPLLAAPARSTGVAGVDGSAAVADVAWLVGGERESVLEERLAAARSATRAAAHP